MAQRIRAGAEKWGAEAPVDGVEVRDLDDELHLRRGHRKLRLRIGQRRHLGGATGPHRAVFQHRLAVGPHPIGADLFPSGDRQALHARGVYQQAQAIGGKAGVGQRLAADAAVVPARRALQRHALCRVDGAS